MSKGNKHTQGPWIPRKGSIKDPIAIDGKLGACTVAYVNRISDREGQANARLIAAAPDMLGTLEWLIAFPDYAENGMPLTREFRLLLEAAGMVVNQAKGEQ